MAKDKKQERIVVTAGDPTLGTSVEQSKEQRKEAGQSEPSTPRNRSASRVDATLPNAVQRAQQQAVSKIEDEDERAAILGTTTHAARPAESRVPADDVGRGRHEAAARAAGIAVPARTRFDGDDAADRMKKVAAVPTQEGTYKVGDTEVGYDGAVVSAGLRQSASTSESTAEDNVAHEAGETGPTDEKAPDTPKADADDDKASKSDKK